MRVVIIGFDALEDKLVKKYNCHNLMQERHGIVDLEDYFQRRPKGVGGRNPNTPDVIASFLTGQYPKRTETYVWYNWLYW